MNLDSYTCISSAIACREGVCLPAVKGFKWKYQVWCFSWTFKSKICVWWVFNRFYFVLCLQIMANIFLSLPSLTCPFPQVQLLKLFHNISVHSRSCSCGSCKQFGNHSPMLLRDNKHDYFTAHGVLFLINSWSYCVFMGAFIQITVKCTVIRN